MGVKRFQVLLVGLLLVLGISSSAMGQITAGITVRVTRPDSGRVVAIGDSIVVVVTNTLSTVPTGVKVRIVPVASISDTNTTTKGAIDSTGAAQGTATTAKFSKVATNITASGGAPTFRASFVIAAGDPEILQRLAAIATVTHAGVEVQFHNLNNANTVGANPGLGTVGDRKMFGIDGQRPIIANVDTVYLDAGLRPAATALIDDGPSVDATNRGYYVAEVPTTTIPNRRAFRAGSTMGVNIVLSGSAISQVASGTLAGAVVLVDSAGIAGISDETKARARVRFLATALLSDTTRAASDTISANQIATVSVAKRFPNSSIARKAISLTAGQFPNNANVTAQAFLIDSAGNLSSTTASGSPQGVTASLTYLVDTVVPAFSSVYPDSTGKRFTGKKSILADTANSSGTGVTNARLGQRPLRWSLSEAVDSLQVRIGGKSFTLGKGAGAVVATGVDSLDIATSTADTAGSIAPAAAGTAYDVSLTAVDYAGNLATTSVTGAILDDKGLEFTGQFPRMINRSNKDTFNTATSSVVFTLTEAADSLRVTYKRVGSSGGTVTTARGQGGGNININLTSTAAQRIDVSSDSLRDQSFYTLQLFGRDLAYNWTVTGPDTLFYNVAFKNPNADTIKVTVASGSNDTVVVNASGTGVLLDVAAQDTVLKSNAVTFNPATVLVDVWSPDTTKSLVGVHISGAGVTEQAALAGRIKRATLNVGGWVLGARQITISDTLAQNMIYVTVRDTAKASRMGRSVALVFEAGQMTQYKLMVADTSNVEANKPFVANVQPQDKYGNPSLKQADAIYTSSGGGNALSEIYVEFGSDNADLGVPAGPQRINSTGWSAFQLLAPSTNGRNRISVRTIHIDGAKISDNQLKSVGHIWVWVTGGGGPVIGPSDPTVAKVDTLIVEDYKGPDGSGDQGGFVLVTFKNTMQHAQLAQYRIWREMRVSTGYDTTMGKLTSLTTPRLMWVPWAVVDAVPRLKGAPPVTRAVIPTIDGVATRWAITAEMGNKSSEAATSSAVGGMQGKVVFSEASVKESLALLGVEAMPQADLEKIIGPSYEFTKTLLGDRKDLLYGRLDLDGLRQVVMRVPDGVRAQTVSVGVSEATVAAAARAIDNIPPAAVTSEAETHTNDRQVSLTWKASTDDRVVGFIPYRGYASPIPGVRTYDVYRGANEQGLVKVASLASGSTTFRDVVGPELGSSLVYRIDATDLDNATKGKLINVVLARTRIKYVTSDGQPVYLMLDPTAAEFDLTADFADFFSFADSFGRNKGETGFNIQADTNDDGAIDFTDFFAFADSFGKTARQPAGKVVARATPVSGANRDAELKLNLASERVVAGQTIKLDVAIGNVVALKGFGLTLTYDPQKFELVEATAGEQNLLSQSGATPVFFKAAEPGRLQIANAITDGGLAVGSGNVAQLVFKVKGEFEDIGRFEIAEGILVDGSQHLNPVVALGALELSTTPKEFALNQNFPNPFNPETHIKYALAEGSQVELRIYNMVGQVIRTLVSERQAAGRYTIRWDGKDDRGLSVSSGIYFYRLTSEKFSDVRKLMLLK